METKKDLLRKYHQWVNDQVDKVLFGALCDSYGRFERFTEIATKLKGENYWHGLSGAYQFSDDLFPYKKEVKLAFRSKKPKRKCLMTPKEQGFLRNLPQRIVIYRGMTEQEYESGDLGVSWTLNRSVAEKFATKYPRNHATAHLKKMVHKITIDKKEVIAFFNEERSEEEIIYLHK